MRCSWAEVFRALNTTGIPATGTVSVQAQIGGTTANPLAEFHVQAADLVAYNELFGALVADGRYSSRQVEVSSLSLDKPQEGGNGRITGTLSYSTRVRALRHERAVGQCAVDDPAAAGRTARDRRR